MKVCYVSDLYHPYALGGAETYLHRLVTEISKFVDVIVVSTTPEGRPVFEGVRRGNVTLYSFTAKPYSIVNYSRKSFTSRHLWQAYNLWNLNSYRMIKKILATEKPDVVHTHNFKGLSPSVFSAIRSGNYLHVHTVHDYNLISPWSNLIRQGLLIQDFTIIDSLYMKYMQFMTRSAKAAIFPSSFALTFHRQMGFFEKVLTQAIPNGIPSDGNSQVASMDHATINALYVGSLSYYKGVHVLLKAFKQCPNPNLRLRIVGEGFDSESLKQLARGDKRIVFHGRVSDTFLEELYRTSSFLILPSLWYEVLPVVIQEAMAHGISIVGSDIGGIRDLVIDGYNGFLFKPGNSKNLAEVIQKLSSSPETLRRLGRNCLEFIRGHDMSVHAQQLISLYQELSG